MPAVIVTTLSILVTAFTYWVGGAAGLLGEIALFTVLVSAVTTFMQSPKR